MPVRVLVDPCTFGTLRIARLPGYLARSRKSYLEARFPETLYAMYASAVAAGLGAKELPAVYEMLRAKRT
jgi:hypothetical protein